MRWERILAISAMGLATLAGATQPDWGLTPGATCTEDDPHFQGYDHPAQIARCERHVTDGQRKAVALAYGIPQGTWHLYEFDHLISLCIGGSNANANLWYQPRAEADEKNVLENELCNQLRAGEIDQEEAIETMMAWLEEQRRSK
jgi:hypothetical protein